MDSRLIYVIGSLSGPKVEEVADRLREEGFDAFDQWRAAKGDFWADYAIRKKLPFKEALKLDFVETAFQFDLKYLKACSAAVLVMPAGRSGGLELGWVLGQGKPGYILYDGEPERPDLMAKLATEVFFNIEDLIKELRPKSTIPTIRFNKETNDWERIKDESSINKLRKIGPPNTWICPTCGKSTSIGCCSCHIGNTGNR